MNQARSWDSYWGSESGLDYWLEPDGAVVALAAKLDKSAVRDVLDLGCGIGRHTLLFAETGFNVTAVDISQTALANLQDRVAGDPRVRIVTGTYSEDIFPARSFDLVLSWNVLYHGSRETFKRAVALTHRWLRPDGLLFFTCPSRRDGKYGSGEEVAANTYRPLNSMHPGDVHYFADRNDLSDFLSGFEEVSVETREHYWDNKGTEQFSSHWLVLARKTPG